MSQPTLAILVGGGPAPGINSVINAATLEASNLGYKVLGIYKGYAGLLAGGRIEPLTVEQVGMIHFKGGSILGTSRTNPARDQATLDEACATLRREGVNCLVTIGGDDTAFGSSSIAANMPELRVVHVPKTIDNDLPLPNNEPTFGYQTARHVGVKLIEHLLEDARTTRRWFLVVSMGRKAGHLALGMGKAAGASLTIIPEEFGDQPIKLKSIADIIEAAVIKELSRGIDWGVAVLAEGLIEQMDAEELGNLAPLVRDAFGHIRLADVDLGRVLSQQVGDSLAAREIKMRFVDIKIGYELRCANPIPFDIEYARDLGSAAVQFLNHGGSGAIITLQGTDPSPLSFAQIRDPKTGRTQVRLVDTKTESYRVARRYMRRLSRQDLDSPEEIALLAETANTTPEAFLEDFGYLVEHEPESFSWSDDVRSRVEHLLAGSS